MTRSRSKLLQGKVDTIVLKVLSRGSLHGYGIARRVAEETDGQLELEDAALYQALHRMESRDLITAEWRRSDTGRRAKFYELTPRGRERLDHEVADWRAYAEAVFKILGT